MMFYKETNFKDTEIGRIPKEWEVVRLGDIAKISSGNTAPQQEIYFQNGRYPFIRVQHLTDLEEQKYPKQFDLINDLAVSEFKLKKFKRGSIIFPKSGESIKLEKRAILKEDSYVVNHLAVVEVINENVDSLFLFYYLLTVKTSNYLTKTTMPSLNLSTIRRFLIPLPPLSEQQKIAEILSTIDQAIQKTNEIIAKTERLKKGLMQELLTKGIGHREFKDTEIGRIPKDWEVTVLGDIAVEIYRYPTYYNITYVEKGVPEVRSELIREDGSLETDLSKYRFIPQEVSQKFPRTILKEGDFVLSVRGTMGKVAMIPRFLEGGNITANLIRISLDRARCYPPFFKQVFLSDSFRRILNELSSRTTVKTIQVSRLKSIKVPLPSLHEQRKIAEILSTVDKKLEIERKEKARLERIKRGLMDLLLTGKVRVKVG